jgi:hypothetical protein
MEDMEKRGKYDFAFGSLERGLMIGAHYNFGPKAISPTLLEQMSEPNEQPTFFTIKGIISYAVGKVITRLIFINFPFAGIRRKFMDEKDLAGISQSPGNNIKNTPWRGEKAPYVPLNELRSRSNSSPA